MNRKGGILIVVGIIFLIFIILLIFVGIYLYNFFIFKTIRICVSGGENSMLPCETDNDCLEVARQNGLDTEILGAPDFIKRFSNDIIEEVFYCNETCFRRDVRGINQETREIELVEACEGGEKELAVDIHGKEAIEFMSWMKSMQSK